MTQHTAHVFGDWSAFIAAWAAFFEVAPKVAAIMSITWMTYRFVGWVVRKIRG